MAIDFNKEKPIYRQIIDNLKIEISSKRYRNGDRLPPIREQAAILQVNPKTVSKAYKVMQKEGMVKNHPGSGCFVTVPEGAEFMRECERLIQEDIDIIYRKADLLEIPRKRLLDLFEKAIQKL